MALVTIETLVVMGDIHKWWAMCMVRRWGVGGCGTGSHGDKWCMGSEWVWHW